MRKSGTHWHPFYPANYLRETQHLTLEEKGAVMALRCQIWENGGPIADDDNRLCLLVGLSLKLWRKISTNVKSCFVLKDGKLTCHYLEKELIACQLRYDRASAGGLAKAKNSRLSTNDGMPKHVSSIAGAMLGVLLPTSTSTNTDLDSNIIEAGNQFSVSPRAQEQAQKFLGNESVLEALVKWNRWQSKQKQPLRNADASFVKWCKRRSTIALIYKDLASDNRGIK